MLRTILAAALVATLAATTPGMLTPEPALADHVVPDDIDEDGLTGTQEDEYGTDPLSPDTDGDGVHDGGDPDIVAAVAAGLPDSAFKDRDDGLRTALMARLDVADGLFGRGNIEDGLGILEDLEWRLDGCPPNPDKDDWIVDCGAQEALRAALAIVVGNHFQYRIDDTVVPSVPALPGLGGGEPRPVGAALGPDGVIQEFVLNEIILPPQSANELGGLLARYGGHVLRDGTPRPEQPTADPSATPAPDGWHLVRVDPNQSVLDDLAVSMERAGLRGSWSFSSEAAARLAALTAREQDHELSPNFLLTAAQCSVCEHQVSATRYLDADTCPVDDSTCFWWFVDDTNPRVAGNQGLQVAVNRAWDYVKYQGYPAEGVPVVPPKIAVIDSGFDLDETTGEPVSLSGGDDWFPTRPAQLDEVDGDWTAGGGISPGWGNCPTPCWHGQQSLGACCALAGNKYGTAGTAGGKEHRLLVIRVGADWWTASTGIKNALYNNADVISMSIEGMCAAWCHSTVAGIGGNGSVLEAAIGSARNQGTIVVAAAGNSGLDISTVDLYPCTVDGAICVGSIDEDARNQYNFGTTVDIWAPTGILTTVTRPSAAKDGNDIGLDETPFYFGTSASTPFVAGVVTLMKMLDPTLRLSRLQSILAATARSSSDPKVRGYIDALAAVQAVRPNRPPVVTITDPGSTSPYLDVTLRATVDDPEDPSPFWDTADFATEIEFRSDKDGTLCSASGDATSGGTALSCTASLLSVGTHTITATATDPFGATGTASKTVTVVNQVPIPRITHPADGSTFFTSQKVNLRGAAFDPDEQLPGGVTLAWKSSLDGPLGTGSNLWVNLTAGDHVITLTATDSLGSTGTTTITVHVNAGDGYPTAQIVSPADSSTYAPGTTITFEGSATDPEDGKLTGSSLVWSSDVDGVLGTGETIKVALSSSGCGVVPRKVTLTATDADGHTATHAITVGVGTIC